MSVALDYGNFGAIFIAVVVAVIIVGFVYIYMNRRDKDEEP